MGLGLFGGGAAVARYLAERGARVTVTDLRDETMLEPALAELAGLDLRYVLGEHRARDFIACDLVVANPAIHPEHRQLINARRAGARVTSEIALFFDACPAAVIAITGTQGKSSTTSFLAQLLAASGRRTHLGGNIGRSLLGELPLMSADDVCAVELSSYQLETLPEQLERGRARSPIRAGAIVNVLSDHLERHGSREEYARAKLRLLEVIRPGGLALMPDDPLPVEFEAADDLELATCAELDLRIEAGEFRFGSEVLGRVADVPFAAPFQLDNLLKALGLAAVFGVPSTQLARALGGLQGLPHRLHEAGRIGRQVLWDNGVSTTPDSTISAILALPPGSAVLMGGQTKDLDLTPLLETLRQCESRVVLFGAARKTWPARFTAFGVEVAEAAGPEQALDWALATPAEQVLFSPACSSFDAYPNFQVRARALLAHARTRGLVEPNEALGARITDI